MKSLLLFLAVSLVALLALTVSYPSSISDLPLAELVLGPRYHTPYDPSTLGIASRIYVLSLPRRDDRRVSMDQLRLALGLDWRYVGAFDDEDARVISITRHLRDYRENITSRIQPIQLSDSVYENNTGRATSEAALTSAQNSTTAPPPDYRFLWPDDLDSLADSKIPLPRSGSDSWSIDSDMDSHHLHPAKFLPVSSLPRLACTTENFVIPQNKNSVDDLPPYLQLTPAKIACWHSHLEILRAVATSGRESGPAIVLEDDVDIEWDVGQRLNKVWSALPDDWDIVFLGASDSSFTTQD